MDFHQFQYRIEKIRKADVTKQEALADKLLKDCKDWCFYCPDCGGKYSFDNELVILNDLIHEENFDFCICIYPAVKVWSEEKYCEKESSYICEAIDEYFSFSFYG